MARRKTKQPWFLSGLCPQRKGEKENNSERRRGSQNLPDACVTCPPFSFTHCASQHPGKSQVWAQRSLHKEHLGEWVTSAFEGPAKLTAERWCGLLTQPGTGSSCQSGGYHKAHLLATHWPSSPSGRAGWCLTDVCQGPLGTDALALVINLAASRSWTALARKAWSTVWQACKTGEEPGY